MQIRWESYGCQIGVTRGTKEQGKENVTKGVRMGMS